MAGAVMLPLSTRIKLALSAMADEAPALAGCITVGGFGLYVWIGAGIFGLPLPS